MPNDELTEEEALLERQIEYEEKFESSLPGVYEHVAPTRPILQQQVAKWKAMEVLNVK
jgi:hypothetical protein